MIMWKYMHMARVTMDSLKKYQINAAELESYRPHDSLVQRLPTLQLDCSSPVLC